jgi:hypothetical protein
MHEHRATVNLTGGRQPIAAGRQLASQLVPAAHHGAHRLVGHEAEAADVALSW